MQRLRKSIGPIWSHTIQLQKVPRLPQCLATVLSVSLRAQCLVTRSIFWRKKHKHKQKHAGKYWAGNITSNRRGVRQHSPHNSIYGFVFPSSHSVEISPSRHPLNFSLRVLFVFFVTVFWFFDLVWFGCFWRARCQRARPMSWTVFVYACLTELLCFLMLTASIFGSLADLLRFWCCHSPSKCEGRLGEKLWFSAFNFEVWRKSRRTARFSSLQMDR